MPLREAVAAKLARDNGVAYDPDSEILVTTGATLGIHAALTALLDDGDEVLLPDPIYDAYQSPIRLAGGRVASVRAPIEDGRFALHGRGARSGGDAGVARAAAQHAVEPGRHRASRETSCAPSPTFVVRRNLVLISDEIYEAIIYDGRRHVSPAALSRRAARAHDRRQQPVEDLRDDRLAGRLLRRAGADHPERCSSCCSSRAAGRRRSSRTRPPWR